MYENQPPFKISENRLCFPKKGSLHSNEPFMQVGCQNVRTDVNFEVNTSKICEHVSISIFRSFANNIKISLK